MIYFFISLVTYITYQILKSRKAIIELNNTNYNINKYKKWIFTKDNFLTLELLWVFIILIAFVYNAKVTGICTIILYMLLSLYEIKKSKNKLQLNSNNITIFTITTIIYLLMFGMLIIDYNHQQKGFFVFDHTNYYYLITFIVGYFNYIIIFIVASITNKLRKSKRNKHKMK